MPESPARRCLCPAASVCDCVWWRPGSVQFVPRSIQSWIRCSLVSTWTVLSEVPRAWSWLPRAWSAFSWATQFAVGREAPWTAALSFPWCEPPQTCWNWGMAYGVFPWRVAVASVPGSPFSFPRSAIVWGRLAKFCLREACRVPEASKIVGCEGSSFSVWWACQAWVVLQGFQRLQSCHLWSADWGPQTCEPKRVSCGWSFQVLAPGKTAYSAQVAAFHSCF